MSYNFTNDKLKSVYVDGQIDVPALSSFVENQEHSFILNHNIGAIESLLFFLNNPNDNLFILNGFMGAGKSYCVDLVSQFFDENVLVFKNSYEDAFNTDDIFLSLFKDFSVYHNDKKIILPKIETNVFSEKITSYIKYCNLPMIFIFDSFEINMRSKDAQNDILDFINYLSRYEKIKIIICSRSFGQEELSSTVGVVDYTITSISAKETGDYLRENDISASEYEVENIYKIIRGHYILLEYSILIMNLLGITLNSFINEYKKSTKNFLEFLLAKILNLSSDKFVKVLLFLSTIRHGVSGEFLIFQNIASIDDIEFLLQKRVISEKFGKYYLKDYIKSEFLKTIGVSTKIKIHEYAIDLYESELPLKPFERGLFLSRQTMRQEISYHNKRIEILSEELIKTGKARTGEAKDFNYLSYSKSSGFDPDLQKKKLSVKQSLRSIRKNVPQKSKARTFKEDNYVFNLTKDDIEQNLVEISKPVEEDIIPAVDLVNSMPDSLADYLDLAENYEKAFNYQNAILYYKKALSFKNDEEFKEKEPFVYLKLAYCSKKLREIDEAEKYYEKVFQIYSATSLQKANEILLELARMFVSVFKYDRATDIYKRILYSSDKNSSVTIIKAYLDLAEIENGNGNIQRALSYSQKAMSSAEKLADVNLLAECYFKYALLLDDSDNLEFAVKFYLRCVQINNNPSENKFLSSAYSNLADISLDNNNLTSAKMYYELAIKADETLNNYEGLYYCYNRLAGLYKKENSEKTYDLLVKALAAAKKFDDLTYAISIYIEIGDYYLGIKEYKKSIKSYILAKTLTPLNANDELSDKIIEKINKIKNFIGVKLFEQLLDEIKKKR